MLGRSGLRERGHNGLRNWEGKHGPRDLRKIRAENFIEEKYIKCGVTLVRGGGRCTGKEGQGGVGGVRACFEKKCRQSIWCFATGAGEGPGPP